MTDPSTGRSSASLHSDALTGLALVVFGGVAAWMAYGFDDISGPYPFALGLILAAAGAALLVRAIAGRTTPSVSFAAPLRAGIPAVAVICAWIAALTGGLGFVLPTFAMQTALMLLGGVRGIGRALLYAALVTGAAYALFVLALDVRMPRSVRPWLW